MSVALHHIDVGSGPALLLGGSLGTTHAMWSAQTAALSASRRVVAFDHRGHGASPEPAGPYAIADLGADVLALADRLGLRRFSYCGLSIGGMVGQWLAAHARERVERLVLICTAAHLGPAAAWRERAAMVRAAGSPEPIADAIVARWLTPAWATAHAAERLALRAMLATSPAEGYASCCEAIADMDLREAIPSIAAPTLVVAAAQDRATPAAHGERIAAAIPEARLVVLDPAAHIPAVERAFDITELIAHHLEAP